MPRTYENPRYPYRRSPDQDGASAHHRVIIVGAGLVGLAAAVDLAGRGIASVVLDDDDTVSFGSRAICFAKRSLEILDRLGIGEKLLEKGVTWNRGKVFFRDRMIYDFDLLPEGGHRWPAFINLQQYYAEEWLVEAAGASGLVDLRWKNRVVDVVPKSQSADVDIETPDGPYRLSCDYLLAADGARSSVRKSLGLSFSGQVFRDRFLIADVVMQAPFPSERWFWFDPPFHQGQSALLHRQPDNVWRIDLQLGWDADPEAEKQPERVIPRLKAMLGEDVDFDLEWVSVYTFQCRRLERFRHGPVFFIGDSAHQVSPFGARGGNGGLQDTDNLCWKLAAVLKGEAPNRLLDSYDAERVPAADENILNSTRSTDFITPKNAISRLFRDATLELAEEHPFARALVNSGRLSQPADMPDSPLVKAAESSFDEALAPGSPCPDAPLTRAGGQTWLLQQIAGGFCGLYYGGEREMARDRGALAKLTLDCPELSVLTISAETPGTTETADVCYDVDGLVAERYGARPGSFYLLRPDQHVAACWPMLSPEAVKEAISRSLALE
ncbi:FAD-dependent oxidoreductase [Pelagibius litoralis]|uniref:FAD-dependent oxidoreductase n=2 Tax=Pelagibius litoralis TaxID=374515 RepID=A0A967EUT2_9PROT|nr:FAD-dependent oxidoreductase [Pelagibius litoralis]